MFDVAYAYYTLIMKWYETAYLTDDMSTRLFANQVNHNFYLPYHMIIVAEHTKNYKTGVKMYEILWTAQNTNMTEWHYGNVINNLKYFISHMEYSKKHATLLQTYISALYDKGITFTKEHTDIIELALTHLNTEIKVDTPISDEWVFYEGCDSFGGDILQITVAKEKLLEIAKNIPNCIAVNTLGWVKDTVAFPPKKILTSGNGIYIRKSIFSQYINGM